MPTAQKDQNRFSHQDAAQSEKADLKISTHTASVSSRFNMKELICPFKVDLSSLNHLKFLSQIPQFIRSFFVSTLPRFLNFSESLRPLYNFPNTNTSVYVYPMNEGIAQSNLNTIINQLEAERLNAIKLGDEAKEKVLSQKKLEAEALRDEISTRFNKLFEVSIISTVFAKSLGELDILSEMLAVEMSKTTTNIKSTWSLQEDALRSNIPYCNNKISVNHTFDTFGLATVFPFISNDISHPNGIPIGINKKNNLPILLDNFNPSFSNYNLILFGKIASGKRVAIQLLTSRSFVLAGIQNIALDADGRYNKVAKSLGGEAIAIGPASKVIINPFELEPEMVKDDITGKERTILNLQNKIADVTTVLMTMARGFIKSQYVNNTTRKIIEEVVAEEYQKAGITNNPDSLYSSSGANLIGNKIIRCKKTIPTIGSWYKSLCKKAEANTNSDLKYHYEYLVKYMKDYVGELGGSISYFDGQTTLEIDEETTYINFDLSKLNIRFSKPLACHILLSWIWEKFIKANSEDRSKAENKRVLIDETYILLDFPEAVDLLDTISQRCIKRNVSLSIISQKFDAFYKNSRLNKLLTTASVKLFMLQTESEIDYLKETFKLTNGERDFLASCSKGEGILQIGTNSAQIYIAPTTHELELIEANPSNFMIMGGEPNQ